MTYALVLLWFHACRVWNSPLKTSLNSPGGAWMTKFAAMRTCSEMGEGVSFSAKQSARHGQEGRLTTRKTFPATTQQAQHAVWLPATATRSETNITAAGLLSQEFSTINGHEDVPRNATPQARGRQVGEKHRVATGSVALADTSLEHFPPPCV